MRRARIGSAAAVLALWSVLLAAAGARAAEPSPTPLGGDPRSAGEGPGLVGEPLLAIAAVVVIGLLAVVLTTAWVRITARRTSADRQGSPPGHRGG